MPTPPFYKQHQFYTTVVSTAIALASLVFARIEHTEKVLAQARHVALADSLQRVQRDSEVERARVRNELSRFIREYGGKLLDMRQALSRYREKPSDETRHELELSVQSMVGLVGKVRAVSRRLNDVGDGHIEALEQALVLHDIGKIADAITLLGSSAETDLAALQDAIRRLNAMSP